MPPSEPPRTLRSDTIPRPSALLVDLFLTLIVLTPGDGRGPPIYETLELDPEAWRCAFFADRAGRLLGHVRDPVEAIRVVAHEVDPSVPEDRIARAAKLRQLRLRHAFEAIPDELLAALDALRAAGTRLALISNAGADEIGGWATSALRSRFDAAVFSCDVALVKPDRAIYDLALERLGASTRDAMFVGDGGSDELRGARAVGLPTVIIEGHARTIWPERVDRALADADHRAPDIADMVRRMGLDF